MHVNEVNSMNDKLKDLKTYKLVYLYLIQHHYFDCSKVEAESDAHGKAKDENTMESRPGKQSLKKEIQETMTS